MYIERMDPVEAFKLVFCRYLLDRGDMVLSMARTTGQKTLKIALYGLWRRHEAEETGYLQFMDIVEELKDCDECLRKLEEIGIIEFANVDNEPYVIVDVNKLDKFMKECMSE
ncbi:hypothetical protein [Pyrodictium abyssi]|uniref:Uncharacterized protein n=1 Tax=Pyrodictium abyssi TaxID=54256 RepID=A0ABN6ZQK2_9CREN|nr:hypothetical protein PABY_21080 [Pyrodictium abyssi]